MRLIQIPFSHNCVKVRVALERKGLAYETVDIVPMFRGQVRRLSGQGLVPVLVDGDRVVTDSTRILLHLEERYPEVPLLPRQAAARAECLVLEDWADTAFMALTRRLAYWSVLATPGVLGRMFFPSSGTAARWAGERLGGIAVKRRFGLSAGRFPRDLNEARRVAGLAVERIGDRSFLLGDGLTIADVALAAMSAPLWGVPDLADDAAVKRLLAWGLPIVGEELASTYRGPRGRAWPAGGLGPGW